MDYVVKKVGRNRGTPRLFLDGQQAVRAGFSPGDRYEVIINEDRVVVEARHDGSRAVSRRVKGDKVLPVIDVESKQLLDLFEGMDSVRMVVTQGKVVFLPLASEKAKVERLKRVTDKLKSGEPLKTASLSHGGGVLSRAIHEGLAKAGIACEMAFANEIREDLIEFATQNNTVWGDNSAAIIAPMQELIQDEWLMAKLPRVEIVELGLPCQGASPAGRTKNAIAKMEDHKDVGHLVFAALTILAKIQPVVMLLENVDAYKNTASAQILRHQLADMGYELHEAVLEGKDFGCMENRVRWVMVAVTKGLEFSFDDLVPEVKVLQKLESLLDPSIGPDHPSWSEKKYLKDKEVRDAEAGKGFRMQTVTPESTSVPTLRKGYHKGGSTDPVLVHPINPALLRKFTGKEHARIKGVPESLVDNMSDTMAHELLGQGIVFAPFEQVGEHIGRTLLKLRPADAYVTVDGDEYRVVGIGAEKDSRLYCHLASTTDFTIQKNGACPKQIMEWIPVEQLGREPQEEALPTP
jgi:DNA (cytosine-5)-methyltransferase 1